MVKVSNAKGIYFDHNHMASCPNSFSNKIIRNEESNLPLNV
jgi:hypothetical protein